MFSEWRCGCLGENKDKQKRQGDLFLSHKQEASFCSVPVPLGCGFLGGDGILPLPHHHPFHVCGKNLMKNLLLLITCVQAYACDFSCERSV